jgi:hypothetical protein
LSGQTYNDSDESNESKTTFNDDTQLKEPQPPLSHLIEPLDANKTASMEAAVPSSSTATEASTSTFNRKRKHTFAPDAAAGTESPVINMKVQEDRDTKLLWRQHISKNAVKTVSICSESTGSLSEGSGSEGRGSAVHSLLHMGDSSSGHSRGSSSGSDDDSTSLKENESTFHAIPPSSQTSSRTYVHAPRTYEGRSEATESKESANHTLYSYPLERPKSLQAILAACSPPLAPPQKKAHWRVPERGYTFSSHNLAGLTAAAVSSIYPTVFVENDNNSGPFRGFVPMRGPPECTKPSTDINASSSGVRNQDFTIYDGHRLRAMKDQ